MTVPKMTTHLLAYYRWNTRRSWRLNALKQGEESRSAIRYINREVGVWKKYAEKDAVIWVVGLSPSRTPTLDARLHVDQVYVRTENRKNWRGVVGLRPRSCFFGLNDATEAMARIAFTNQRAKAWRLDPMDASRAWSSQHGRRLQNPLRLAPEGDRIEGMADSPGASPLVDLAKSATSHSVFVSYKHDDLEDRGSRAFLDQLASELARKGLAVWLDRIALEGTGGEKRQMESDRTITELLRQGLDQSRVVVGVWSDNYGTPSALDGENWTQAEWHGGRPAKKRIALDMSPTSRKVEGLKKPHARVRLPEALDPSQSEAVADEIMRACRPFWKKE